MRVEEICLLEKVDGETGEVILYSWIYLVCHHLYGVYMATHPR